MLTSKQVVDWLGLVPNAAEGGYFAPVYESSVKLPSGTIASGVQQERSLCSAIYYLLDAAGCSVMHRVAGDMIYHFYDGDPVEMLLLYPKGQANRHENCIFSNNIASGGQPMKVIPGGTWLGSRLTPGGTYALMGVSMAPGFDPNEYMIGQRNELVREFPEQAALIKELTRESNQ
jgi:predicted cupin superfamily sugar epimerase